MNSWQKKQYDQGRLKDSIVHAMYDSGYFNMREIAEYYGVSITVIRNRIERAKRRQRRIDKLDVVQANENPSSFLDFMMGRT